MEPSPPQPLPTNGTVPTRGRRWRGGVMALIGFVLSPLSWWNDLFVNVPLALAVAWPLSLLWPAAFTSAFVTAYWLTNILGLVLMQKGAAQAWSGAPRPYSGRALLKDAAVALAYTALILILIRLRVFQPLPDYFRAWRATAG